MDNQVKIVEWLVFAALKEARIVQHRAVRTGVEFTNLTPPPGYWNVVLVLLEEVVGVLIEKPEGRHGDGEEIPF